MWYKNGHKAAIRWILENYDVKYLPILIQKLLTMMKQMDYLFSSNAISKSLVNKLFSPI